MNREKTDEKMTVFCRQSTIPDLPEDWSPSYYGPRKPGRKNVRICTQILFLRRVLTVSMSPHRNGGLPD